VLAASMLRAMCNMKAVALEATSTSNI
jgi:hypothetical protein